MHGQQNIKTQLKVACLCRKLRKIRSRETLNKYKWKPIFKNRHVRFRQGKSSDNAALRHDPCEEKGSELPNSEDCRCTIRRRYFLKCC